jgi:alpha-L-rhamnosidase
MTDTQILTDQIPSHWITSSNDPDYTYSIYNFRKSIDLKHTYVSYKINISADNRYKLLVNGNFVATGPPRGDLSNWYYDEIDIAPFLNNGKNIIAVSVWNMGQYATIGQNSLKTGLSIQECSSNEDQKINTDSSWKVMKNDAYSPCSLSNQARLNAYMVVGPGDKVDGNRSPWNWEQHDYDDTDWEQAEVIDPDLLKDVTEKNIWQLTKRDIPIFKEEQVRFSVIRRSTTNLNSANFINKNNFLVIPKNQTHSILLDHEEITIAYPELTVSAGKDASIKLIYAESLFDKSGNKGNRNEIENKRIFGNYDHFITDGGGNRIFRPLSIRAYRYLQLDIITKDEPLIINDIYSMTSKYPFTLKANFKSSDTSLEEIWNVGWRTAQLCAGEVYYDTPYYEQLQYVADARIQSLISLYTSGDDRLMRKAILQFSYSIIPEGLTQSRYPSNQKQVIPAFSLFWVTMIHDHWMHKKDDLFIKQFLPAIHKIMQWFKEKIDLTKDMLGPLPYWNFVDWGDNFDERGTAPGSENGNSAIISLHYSYTLQQAADLTITYGDHNIAEEYRILAAELNHNTFLYCYNEEKGLIADTPEKTSYSQHAGIWAILSGTIPSYANQTMIKKLMEDKSIGQVTYFYRFYWVQALKKAGLADLYYGQLTPWRDMLKLGLTTFAEKPEPTRSDCHGWSASPVYDFLATICGMMPASPGFETVLIKPALGELTSVEGSMPHPLGMITIKLERQRINGVSCEIILPDELTGTFQWYGKTVCLHGGKQTIEC